MASTTTSGSSHGDSPAVLDVEIPERAHGNDVDANQSIVSNLSDDGTHSASVVHRVKANITSIMADSWAIMTAKDVPDSEEDDDYGTNGNGEPKTTQNQSKDALKALGTFNTTATQSEGEQEQHQRHEPTIDFLLDQPKTMTYGRRIALSLAKHSWYNPQLKQQKQQSTENKDGDNNKNTVPLVERRPPKVTRKETPSLARAWAYFDRFVLPRFTLHEDGTFDRHDLKRAEPGESDLETKLYHPFCTPLSQMGDFGLGIGLYFSTLRALTILTFLAGLLNIPNFIYFSGPEYSNSQPGIPDLLKGSAICTVKQWVPCEGCQTKNFDRHRFATAVSVQNETGIFTPVNATFALKNDCADIALEQGMINYGTLLFIIFGIMVINFYQRRKEIEFDEDEQTAQDYSIRIMNPPKDAVDPAEWRAFFKDAFDAHATVVTIALDNDPLIRALRERRECLRKIELNLEPGTSLDTLTLAKIAAEVETSRRFFGRLLAYVSNGIPEHFGRMAELEAKIKGWAQLDYPCSSVFVTFETEAEQRRVLSGLALGSYHVKRQTRSKLDSKYLFRGALVLSIKEPDEPSTIRWADLNVKSIDKLKPLATTTVSSLIAIFLIALLVNVIHETSPAWAAIAIAVFNSLFPMIAKMLTSLERHSSEGLKQTSLYFKIALFRWVNTAVVITIITPFTATVEAGNGLIPSIYAIFFADIVTTNAVQFLDPAGHFKRHFVAPRAKTQDAMNLAMQGAEIELAERYTNMTKILFLTLWYCSIFPGALFFCSFALGVNYFVDGFCLMRTWKRLPHLGTHFAI
ncbi:Calcium-activated chloride channel [Fragilaria crotonensis]|nr:Calcium-activated chloride channel [Fragilaria crotonensis]